MAVLDAAFCDDSDREALHARIDRFLANKGMTSSSAAADDGEPVR